MREECFFVGREYESIKLESMIKKFNTYDQFERFFSSDMLNNDSKTGRYLFYLLSRYDKEATIVSEEAGLNRYYVGNI